MRWNSSIGVNLILGMLIMGSLGFMYSNQTSFEDQNILNLDDREFEVEESNNRVKVIIEGGDQPINIDLPKIREELGIGSNIKLDVVVYSGQTLIENQIFDGDTIELNTGSNSIIKNNTINNFKNTVDNTAGVQAYGIKVTNSLNVTIVNNTISNIAASSVVSRPPCTATICESIAAGIWLSSVSNSIIVNNTIQNIVANSTFDGQNSAYGVYSFWAYNNSYVNNEISNIVADTASNLEIKTRAYGFYAFTSDSFNGKLNFSNNLIKDITARLDISASTLKTPIVAAYGIYLNNANDTKIDYNRFENINSIATHNVFEHTRSQSYGVYLAGSNWLDRLNVSNNKFMTINSTAHEVDGFTTAVPTANSWGIYAESRSPSKPVINATFQNNELNGIYAISNQAATTMGIDISYFPFVKIINNTLDNLISSLFNSLDGPVLSQKQTTVYGIHVSGGMNVTVHDNQIRSLISTGDNNSLLRVGVLTGIWISAPNSSITNNIVEELLYNLPIMADHYIYGYGIRIDAGHGRVQNNEITKFVTTYINGGWFQMTGIQVGLPDTTFKIGSNDTKILDNKVGSGISHKFWGIKVEYSTNTELIDNVVFGTSTLPIYDYKDDLLPPVHFEYYFTSSGDSIIRSEVGLMTSIAYISYLHAGVENITATKDGVQVANQRADDFDRPLLLQTAGLAVGTVVYGVSTLSGDLLSTITLTISSDNSAPFASQLPDLTFEQGILPKSIGWSAKDGSPSTYRILQDHVQIATGNWLSNVPVLHDITSLVVGTYNLTIEFSDAAGRKTSSGLNVEIYADTSAPILLQKPGAVLVAAEGGTFVLPFIAIDNHPTTWAMYINGTTNGGLQLWQNNVAFDQTVDTSASGIFNYTIVISDVYNQKLTYTMIIDVRPDTTIPSVGHTGGINFAAGELGKVITFSIYEQNGGTYTLLQDDVEKDTGPLTTDTTEVVWDVTSLTPGIYNFTMTATDGAGNFGWSYVIVTVFADASVPTIVWQPSITITEGDTNQFVRFTGWDNNPGTYELFMDDVSVDSGTWVSALEITYSLDGLAAGGYNFRMEMSDTAGNTISKDTYVTVLPADTGPTDTTPTDTGFSDTFSDDGGDDSSGGFLPSPALSILAIFGMVFIANLSKKKK